MNACKTCGKQYRVKPSRAPKSSYCSRPCMAQGYRARLIGDANPNFSDASKRLCAFCNTRYSSYNKTRKYCSQECYRGANPKAGERTGRKRKPSVRTPRLELVRPCGFCGAGSLKRNENTCGSAECVTAYKAAKRGRGRIIPDKKCPQCGMLFHASPSTNRIYCSYQCHLDSGGALRAGIAAAMAKQKYGAKKDANHGSIVGAFEKLGCNCLDLSDVGCGCPDLLIWHPATERVFFVDVKNPETGYGRRGLNKLQKKWADSWGAPVYMVYTDVDAEHLVAGQHKKVKSHGGGAPYARWG